MQYIAARLLDLAFIGALVFLRLYQGQKAVGRSGTMRSTFRLKDASPSMPASPPQQHDHTRDEEHAVPAEQTSQTSQPASELHGQPSAASVQSVDVPVLNTLASGNIGTYQSTLKPITSTTSSKVLTLEDIDKPGALLASLLLRPDMESAAAALEVGAPLKATEHAIGRQKRGQKKCGLTANACLHFP